MDFNTLVKTQLFPILQKYGFKMTEEFKNVLRFQSSVIKINIVFDEYDNSHFIEIGRLGGLLYPLNDRIIKDLFNSSLSIEHVMTETFVQNLISLFKTKDGHEILKGNINHLMTYESTGINDYNVKMLHNQALLIALKAWEAHDYVTFVKSIDNVGINNIPLSYQLKYKIAKQKL